MVLFILGGPLLALGLAMMTRGWIYTLRPDGKIAEKRKRKNLQIGFPTDMKLFGRKVRRVGLLLALAGGGMIGWQLSLRADAAVVTARPLPAP